MAFSYIVLLDSSFDDNDVILVYLVFSFHVLPLMFVPLFSSVKIDNYSRKCSIFSFHMGFFCLWVFSSCWFSYYQSIILSKILQLHIVLYYILLSREIYRIIDPIVRFPGSSWAFAFLFLFILFKGSLSLIFVSCITPNSFSILDLFFRSLYSIIPPQNVLRHLSDHLWGSYRTSQ